MTDTAARAARPGSTHAPLARREPRPDGTRARPAALRSRVPAHARQHDRDHLPLPPGGPRRPSPRTVVDPAHHVRRDGAPLPRLPRPGRRRRGRLRRAGALPARAADAVRRLLRPAQPAGLGDRPRAHRAPAARRRARRPLGRSAPRHDPLGHRAVPLGARRQRGAARRAALRRRHRGRVPAPAAVRPGDPGRDPGPAAEPRVRPDPRAAAVRRRGVRVPRPAPADARHLAALARVGDRPAGPVLRRRPRVRRGGADRHRGVRALHRVPRLEDGRARAGRARARRQQPLPVPPRTLQRLVDGAGRDRAARAARRPRAPRQRHRRAHGLVLPPRRAADPRALLRPGAVRG